jgi:hypothetical protein
MKFEGGKSAMVKKFVVVLESMEGLLGSDGNEAKSLQVELENFVSHKLD